MSGLAAVIDAELASYRLDQEELQKLQGDQQVLAGQLNENEMVKQELDLLETGAIVYKMVGPVLMKNPLEDAKQTVDKRLEFIKGEMTKVEKKMDVMSKQVASKAEKIQKMQAELQTATAEAVRAVAPTN